MRNKGQIQITLSLLLTAGGIVAAAVASVFGMQLHTQQETADISERAAKLETAVPRIEATFEREIGLLREDIRDIKKALNIK